MTSIYVGGNCLWTMKRTVTILITFLLLGCKTNPTETLLKEARQLDSLERYKEAIVIYDKILRIDENNIHALFDRAVDKGLTGDREGELTDLHKILKLDSINTLALFNLGVTYGNMRQYKESIEAFNKAMKTKGGEHVTMDFVQNDFVPDLGKDDVPTVDIKLERGIVFYKADSVRKAYIDLTYCIERKHKLGDSYYYRGWTYLKADKLKEACEDFKMSELNGMKEATEIFNEVCR